VVDLRSGASTPRKLTLCHDRTGLIGTGWITPKNSETDRSYQLKPGRGRWRAHARDRYESQHAAVTDHLICALGDNK
jgi:hypothetical protein